MRQRQEILTKQSNKSLGSLSKKEETKGLKRERKKWWENKRKMNRRELNWNKRWNHYGKKRYYDWSMDKEKMKIKLRRMIKLKTDEKIEEGQKWKLRVKGKRNIWK